MEAKAQAQVDARMQAISISASGETRSTTISSLDEWLNPVLDTAKGRSIATFYEPMYAAVSYAIKVLLYMALRQACSIEHGEYGEAMLRIAGNQESKKPNHKGWAKCLIILVPAAGLEPAT